MAHGVSIYLACKDYPKPCKTGKKGASLVLSGKAATYITAPAEGRFQSIALFFDRQNRGSLALNGTASASLSGAVYGRVAGARLSGSSHVVGSGGPLAIATLTKTGRSWVNVDNGR